MISVRFFFEYTNKVQNILKTGHIVAEILFIYIYIQKKVAALMFSYVTKLKTKEREMQTK